MLLDDLFEADVELDNTKFWCNVGTGKIIWLGGTEHHGHVLYYDPQMFGLSQQEVAHLSNHPAMRSLDSEEPDEGGRIIYLPELFWQAMQHGWVRGGMEGEYDANDRNIMRPYGLYLEGKSLADLAKAARLIAKEVEPDDDWPEPDKWTIESIRLAVRAGPQRDNEQSYRLGGERARYFIKRGRIPSQMMTEATAGDLPWRHITLTRRRKT